MPIDVKIEVFVADVIILISNGSKPPVAILSVFLHSNALENKTASHERERVENYAQKYRLIQDLFKEQMEKDID